tara:strand:+ start:159 stop:647 length:489 start_codon:yes stop_codon:yes gene_type:complete
MQIYCSQYPHHPLIDICIRAIAQGTLFLAWWSFLGDYGSSFPFLEQTYFGQALLGAYVVLSQILLANLLIALMTDSYAEIRENAKEEWKYNRFAFLKQYSSAEILPPPFNIPFTLVRWVKDIVIRTRSDKSVAKEKENGMMQGRWYIYRSIFIYKRIGVDHS